MTEEKKPKSKERAAVLIKAALEALKEAGESLYCLLAPFLVPMVHSRSGAVPVING